jgi:hypothetical protein
MIFFGIYKPKIKFQKWGTVADQFQPKPRLAGSVQWPRWPNWPMPGMRRGCGHHVGLSHATTWCCAHRRCTSGRGGARFVGGAPTSSGRPAGQGGVVGSSPRQCGTGEAAEAAAFPILAEGSCSKER